MTGHDIALEEGRPLEAPDSPRSAAHSLSPRASSSDIGVMDFDKEFQGPRKSNWRYSGDLPRRKFSWSAVAGVVLLAIGALYFAATSGVPLDLFRGSPDDAYLQHVASLFSSQSKPRSPRSNSIAWVAHAAKMPGRDPWEYAESIAQLECYTSQRHIPFYFELLNYSPKTDVQGFMTFRHHASIKHLRNYDWIIFSDLDVFIADSRIDLRYFLDDSVDVLLSDRENGEICACAYAVRASPGGFEFLRRWIEWGTDRHGANQDNGNLLEMLMAGMARGGFGISDGETRQSAIDSMDPNNQAGRNEDVNEHSDWPRVDYDYVHKFIPVFVDAFKPERTAEPNAPSWQMTLWPHSKIPTKVKVFKPYAGMIRTAGAEVPEGDGGYGVNAVPGDFLMHAKHAQLRITDEMTRCTEKDWRVEHWLPLKTAQDQLKWTFPHYVGCHFSEQGLGYVC